MNTLAHIFKTQEDNTQVRTIMDVNDVPWFCCTDVARAVGYKDPRTAVRDWMHERQNINEISMGGKYPPTDLQALFGNSWTSTALINESMMYKFLMRSRAPKADAFVEWVTGTVLPSIRKTGAYSVAAPKVMSMQEYFEKSVAHYREMLSLAEAAGLNDWYTQAQFRRANPWYGNRKVHKTLNDISARLGHEVRVRANLTSSDEYSPANMYHIDVFKEFAASMDMPAVVPRVAREWQEGMNPDMVFLN